MHIAKIGAENYGMISTSTFTFMFRQEDSAFEILVMQASQRIKVSFH